MIQIENQITFKNAEIVLNYHKIKKFLMVLKSFHHPIRQKIIQIIDHKKSINVTDLYNSLELGQSITSQHLSNLRKAGIIITKRNGKNIFYSINYPFIEKINNIILNQSIL